MDKFEIIKDLDASGRITIPAPYRLFLGVSTGSKFKVTFDTKTKEITLKKVEE